MLKTLYSHARRISYHLGNRVVLGRKSFRFKGYTSTPLPNVKQHEPYLNRVLEEVLNKSHGTFVDVGVNAGQTLMKVLSIDPNRRYIGFEPQVSCCSDVQHFLAINHIENASVIPIALADRNGMLTFYSRGFGDQMASLTNDNSAYSEPVRTSYVQSRLGDEVLAEIGISDICAIKVDVEGAELQVLSGLRGTIARMHPALIFEILPNFHGVEERIMHPPAYCEANREKADAIFDLLTLFGYGVSMIANDGTVAPISSFELDDRANFRGSNYIALPV